MVLLAGEAKEPVSGGTCGNMCLINPVYGEYSVRLPVHRSAALFVLIIERTSVLIYHDSIIMKRFIAASVELFGKKARFMSQRFCRVIYYKIIHIITFAEVLKTVLIIDMYSVILKTYRIVGEILLADIHKHIVRLNNIYYLNLLIVSKLSGNTAVTATENENSLNLGMNGHRNMYDHLIISKLVLLGKDNVTVRSKELTKLRRIKNIYSLKFATAGKKLLADPDTDLNISGVHITEPIIHLCHYRSPIYFNTKSSEISSLSGPCIEHPFSIAVLIYERISPVITSPGERIGIPGG